MYIREIVLEGFKSYATRTVIEGFDPHFNAITGLNGSGKSNVLDSICFVLGIRNLQQVRVSQTKELIYKNGQAGINKANVTINFDNTDKAASPEEYKRHDNLSIRREIKFDGSSRYTLNGSNTTTEKIKNLFMHVGLNVENGGFIIMQGHITKVVNMKPRDILRQIEEAAHITMYEQRKNQALKMIEKKNLKFQDIERILAEELEPKIEKLRNEREEYYLWKKQNEELEKLEAGIAMYEHRE